MPESNLFRARPIEAMQIPVMEEHEAAKDFEERNRKVAAWVDGIRLLEETIENVEFDKEGLYFELWQNGRDVAVVVPPGRWLVWSRINGLTIYEDHQFNYLFISSNF